MSLKVFHIIFILVSIALAAFCAAWAFANHAAPLFGYGAVVAGVIMLIYGVWFLRKARHIIT
jgi:uncharacterized membrane protein SirB2